MKETEKNKLMLDRFLNDLRSKDEEKMNKALDELQIHGNEQVISVLAEIYPETSHTFKHRIIDFLADVRKETFADAIIENIKNTTNEQTRTAFLSVIWSSRLDFSDYLNVFVDFAIHGQLDQAIECYTIVTTMEGPFSESILLEAKMNLKEHFSQFSKDEHRLTLLTEMMEKLNEFDQEIEF